MLPLGISRWFADEMVGGPSVDWVVVVVVVVWAVVENGVAALSLRLDFESEIVMALVRAVVPGAGLLPPVVTLSV